MKGNGKIHLNKAVRRVCAFLAFALLVSFAVYVINRTLMPKYVFGTHGNPMTSTYLGFYEMEEDTVDVLLLGSSQMGAGLNPQDIYDEAGIRSYNLASNNQPLWVSYYWLREALNYQSPKVVVLDCYMLFFDQNIEEDQVRQALDYMKPGLVK